MASPIYIWLNDESGNPVKGSSTVQGRENSIEAIDLQHEIFMPTDKNTGGLTGVRIHSALTYVASIDASVPILLDACARGKALQSAKMVFYDINTQGSEGEYYRIELQNARVTSVKTIVDDIKDERNERKTHRVQVDLRYEKITWHYQDGNIQASDEWAKRA
jgi:type VI secretion system secreted protein Hcp